jgi:hypothetical protein
MGGGFYVPVKATQNSWCQEIKKLLGHWGSGKSQGNHQDITRFQQESGFFFCGAMVSHTRRKKTPNFFLFTDYFFLKIPRKNLVFGLFTVKNCIISRDIPGSDINLTRK